MKSLQSKKEANSSPNDLKEGVARRNLDKELDGSISPDRGVLTDTIDDDLQRSQRTMTLRHLEETRSQLHKIQFKYFLYCIE